jgi:radical SAM-linked protein
MRLLERAVRRADIPIAMTEGFNPRPRLSFPLALGVGVEALREIVEMDLAEWVHPTEAQRRLNAQLPDGLRMTECKAISPRDTAQVTSVMYEIELREPLPSDATPRALLQARELRVMRKREEGRREIDIRPYLLDIQANGQKMTVHMKVTPSGSARPEEVVVALADLARREIHFAKITRTHVTLAPSAEAKRRTPRE